ncbi:hypothetical protein IQK56_22450 [Pseudomonas sp. MAFF 301449]|uniref:Uncharacterized protein n=1 Tax=Pseudomonas cyclaminis TaxID=2781239 RepID=A0ABR9SX23_9PSED|nr:hypothetical protein [Pseudomonas cyclaminis]MBE8593453.1 hypothetical protein [Pseudomonas cyclaminis]MBE8600924.1 hypothetical protein [Pseudomonas cyclaminis]
MAVMTKECCGCASNVDFGTRMVTIAHADSSTRKSLMTMLQTSLRKNIRVQSNTFSHALSQTLTVLSERISQAQASIAAIDRLSLRSAERERTRALAPTQACVQQCQQQFDRHKGEGRGFGWLLSPLATHQASVELKAARLQHEQAILAFDEPAITAQRNSDIDEHNRYVAGQHEEQLKLKDLLAELLKSQRQLKDFELAAAGALAAAKGDGWLAPDFAVNLARVMDLVREVKMPQAHDCLGQLVFQKTPDVAAYAKLRKCAEGIRERANRDHFGVAVTGGFPNIVAASAGLAAANMQRDPARQLLQCRQTADQWQLLSQLATSPTHLSIDVLWAIYWAMFQCQQEMARFLNSAAAIEDLLNGRFSAYVEHWLGSWASKQVPKFGYPMSQSFLGTLQLAGKPEESRLGADLGVIISLNIGGLICRKAVLLQAKRAKDWVADVGSKKGQLPKLSKLPRGGYYLFYHESANLQLATAVPTVSSAQALEQLLLTAGKNPDGTYLPVDVRETGWDWASFISFGLCDAHSQIGEPFDTIDDALRILGSGETGALPLRLFVVAIEDEPYVLEMAQRVREHYVDLQEPLTKKERKQLDGDERDHSHGM